MRLCTLTMFGLLACDGGEGGDSARVCDGGADYDLSASAAGLKGLDGATVWVSAIEPADSPHTDDAVTVFLVDSVEDGAFSASCDASLSDNMRYPSVAVVIDADGDGACSDGDRWAVGQYYGWDDHQRFSVTDADLGTLDGDTTWGDRSVCDYYVPDDLL